MDPSQTKQQPTKPPDDCPDPNPPYADFRVTTAVAQERARLYTADAAPIKTRFELLGGAQKRFADAKTAQSAKFQDLKQRMEHIAATLKNDLDEAERRRLDDCWSRLEGETAPPATTTDCADVDGVDCDKLPTDDARLRELETLATACTTRADAEFDALAGLPDGFEALIADLLAKATTLEQDVCATRTDLRRSYVEYLGLHQRFEALQKDWTTPPAYGCLLKVAFATLLRRHTVLICLLVESYRRAQLVLIAEEARQAKEGNLVDLVLECARPAAQSTPAAP